MILLDYGSKLLACTIVYAGNNRDSESMVEIDTDGFFFCAQLRVWLDFWSNSLFGF